MRNALSLTVALGLIACGGSHPPADTPQPVAIAPEPIASEPVDTSSSDTQPMTKADESEEQGQWDVVSRETDRKPSPTTVIATDQRPDTSQILPERFRVYVSGNTVINHPQPGFKERVLPTVNDFRGAPGCYVACYSHDAHQSIYGVGGNIYVMGQVRVPGHYEGRVCLPDRYGHADISAAPGIKELCKASIPACGNGCWGGGDTGGWFGVH